MSIYQFSKETGIPKGRVYAWKEGRGKPKAEDARIITTYLNSKGIRGTSEGQEVTLKLPNLNDKSKAYDALFAVLIADYAAWKGQQTGENPQVIVRKLYKAAEDVQQIG